MKKDLEAIILLAFITHQYYTLQDLLIDVLIQAVAGAENHTSKQQKETAYLLRKTKGSTIEQVVGSFLTNRQLVKQIQAFMPGDVEVWVRALINGKWTDATIITIHLGNK